MGPMLAPWTLLSGILAGSSRLCNWLSLWFFWCWGCLSKSHDGSFPLSLLYGCTQHDDVIKWKHFPRYWPFVRGIHRSPVNSPHKGHWRRALMFSFICVWLNGWVNNREAGDLRRHRAHYDVTVMINSLIVWPRQNRAKRWIYFTAAYCC